MSRRRELRNVLKGLEQERQGIKGQIHSDETLTPAEREQMSESLAWYDSRIAGVKQQL